MTKYEKLQSQTGEQLKEHESRAQRERAELQLQMDISETKLELSNAKERLQKEFLSKIFSSKKIIAAQLEVEELELGLKRLEYLKTDLFTDLDDRKDEMLSV